MNAMPSDIQTPQSLKNHVRFQPAFHFFAVPIVMACLFAAIYRVFKVSDAQSVWILLFVVAAFVSLFLGRVNALKVQDRVIRLEERLRLTTLLPENLRQRIPDLSEAQLVGLRFASDAEVPALVGKTLEGNWTAKQIKQAIQVWRPDTFRV